MSSGTTADPTKPDAPVTNTRIWNLPLMSFAVMAVTLMTVADIPLRSRHEPVAAQRARPPRAGGAGALRRARLRPDDCRGDRRTSGTDRANILPAFRRQTGSVVLGAGRADRVGDEAHRRRP